MSYHGHEIATFNGKPIELYYFEGEFDTYLYTSCEIDWTQALEGSEDLVTFVSIPIKRGAMKVGTQDDDKLDLTLELPVSTQLALDYAFQITPPSLNVTVYRIHRDDDELITYWTGKVTNIKVSGDTAILQTPSILSSALDGACPSIWYQTPCNHHLYDPDTCGVIRADFSIDTMVTMLDGISVGIADDGGRPDGFYIAGEVVDLASGERRMIVSHVGDLLTVTYPFAGMPVGAAVNVAAGCDHDWGSDCATKFNNQLRCGCYGKFTPPDNPFISGID